jgi:hypothetical protein
MGTPIPEESSKCDGVPIHEGYRTALMQNCIFEDAAGSGEAFPSLRVALGAGAGNRHHIVRLKSAGAALKPEHLSILGMRLSMIRIVSREMSFCSESIHTDRHL